MGKGGRSSRVKVPELSCSGLSEPSHTSPHLLSQGGTQLTAERPLKQTHTCTGIQEDKSYNNHTHVPCSLTIGWRTRLPVWPLGWGWDCQSHYCVGNETVLVSLLGGERDCQSDHWVGDETASLTTVLGMRLC